MTLRRVLPWCLAALLPTLPIAAQPLPLPGTEAAPSIFKTQIGSPDVNLLVTGSWDAELSGSLGWGLDVGSGAQTPGIYPASFPGLQPGIVFQQVPNLTASVVLYDRYFMKASFVSPTLQQTNLQPTLPLDLNTFVLGYNGRPGEFLQRVRIGNSDVNISPYSFVSFPDAPLNSIGASVLFKTDRARYEAMVRYEPADFHTKTFIGNTQLLQQRINPGGYINGRFFYLPDTNVSNLQVYVEDGTGTIKGSDGHYYRLATAADAIISASQGYVFFVKPLIGRAIVTYTVNGAPVGTTGNGKGFLPVFNTDGSINPTGTPIDFNFALASYVMPGYPSGFDMANLKVTVNGQTGLLISQPGIFSPFEADNTYTVSQTIPAVAPQVRASLVSKGADSGSALWVSVSPAGQTATILGIQPQGGGQAAPDPRSIAARYPLASADPYIYTAGPGRAPQDVSNELLMQILSPVAGYQLEPNVLPGSVGVLRNGVSEGRFTVNYSTGLLTFNTPIAANDLIVISYRTANPQSSGGNILFGLGADFALSPALSLDLGTGLRWSLLSQRYTTEQGSNTGSLLTGVGLNYHTKELTARLRAGVSLSSPDTTGNFRLFGMEESGQTLTFTESNLFPSSLPDPSEDAALGATLTQSSRGELLYKDLNSYSAGGATLEGATFNPPANQIYPYVNGSRIGPYPAWDNTYGVVMVMDYVMDPTASPNPTNWVGAQVPLPNAPQNLTGITDLTFDVQSLAGSSGTVTAYIQLGAISENLDGSGVIERATSVADNLFPFHLANGQVLYAGATGQAGSSSSFAGSAASTSANPSETNGLALASDDLNGNGLLDLETPGLVITYPIPAADLTPGSGWQSVDIPISPGLRALLTSAQSIRVILVASGGTAASGRLLISSPTFAGSPFQVVTTTSSGTSGSPGDVTTAAETNDPQPVGQQLVDRYPQVASIFHPNGQINKVLDVEWGAPYPTAWSTAKVWTLTGYPPPVSSGLYRTLSFYMFVPSLQSGTTATLSMNLVDAYGHGIHLSFQTGTTSGWHKYTVDLLSRTITMDGGSVGSPSVTVDGGAGQLTTMTLSQSGADDGNLYIDEVHFENPIISASLGSDLNLRYSKQGTVLSIAGHPIVSNLSVHEAASAMGANFASGFAENPGVATASTLTEVGGDLPFGNLQASFGYSWSPVYTTVTASHALRVPLGPLTLSDSYNQSVASSGASSGSLVGTGTTSGGSAASTTSSLAGSSIGTGSQAMSFSRSDTATLALPQAITASLSSGAVTLGGGLNQTWGGSLASLFTPPFSFSFTGQLGDNLPVFTPYSDQYFTNWAEGFKLLAPLSDPLAERTGALTSDIAYSQTPVGVDLRSQINYDSTVTNLRSQANSTVVTLSFPISLGNRPQLAWQIVPAYTRTLTTSAPAPANSTFANDLQTYGASLKNLPILFEGVPIAELFSPSALAQFTQESAPYLSATYIPNVSIQLNRGSTSTLEDLFIPTYLQVSYGRTLDREADGVTDTATWQIAERTDVLNLFGREGVYPIFRFYNTDEFATTVDIQESTPIGTTLPTASAQIQHLFSFYGNNHSLLTLQNQLTINWGAINNVQDDFLTSFTWRRIPPPTMKVPLIPPSFQPGMYFEHTESVEVKTLPDVLVNSLALSVSHQTALIFPQRGKVQASVGLGFQSNELSTTDTRILFGIQAAIEGTLSF